MATAADEPRGQSWKRAALALAVVFVAGQFALIAVSQTGETRFFGWAPHDQRAQFAISVEIDGVALTPDEVHRRYRRSQGLDPRSYANVLHIIEHHETTDGADDDAKVEVRFRINAGEEQVWQWPSS